MEFDEVFCGLPASVNEKPREPWVSRKLEDIITCALTFIVLQIDKKIIGTRIKRAFLIYHKMSLLHDLCFFFASNVSKLKVIFSKCQQVIEIFIWN